MTTIPKLVALALLVGACATSAGAQELPTTQLQDHGQAVLHGATTRSILRANQGNRRGERSNAAIARAKCAAATRRVAAGAGDPALLRLCARAGYR
ncbi:hypothetical protein [Sphingomonas sp. Y38-1Y]|uniref:hypothetical protein n=1 Tax=Sphingomonas sp. Y38-1Y TaxID=3078265 RepID=UPI0028F0E528|nr:hypothetical protein [Sphingomonas sp. Y38-1Y]